MSEYNSYCFLNFLNSFCGFRIAWISLPRFQPLQPRSTEELSRTHWRLTAQSNEYTINSRRVCCNNSHARPRHLGHFFVCVCFVWRIIVNAARCPPRPSRARGSTASSRAGQGAIQAWTGFGVVGPIDVESQIDCCWLALRPGAGLGLPWAGCGWAVL